MVNVRARWFWIVSCAWLTSLGACSDDGDAPGAPPGGGAEDARVSMRDAGDAASEDVVVDAAASLDGSVDAGDEPDAGDLSECQGDLLEFRVANGEGRPFSTAIQGNRIHLAYMVPAGGRPFHDARSQGIAYVSFLTSGEASEPLDVANVGDTVSWKTRDPALAASQTGLSLFYAANNSGAYELYHANLSGNDPALQLTDNQRNELYLAASPFRDGALVIYSDQVGQQRAPGAVTLRQMPAQTVHTLVEESDKHASQLALAELGPDSAPVGAYAFVSDLDEPMGRAGIYLQALSNDGEPQGTLRLLTTQLGGRSQVALARGRAGGAVIYTEAPGSVIHQLRFRELSDTGVASEQVRNLTSANQDLFDIALASYSQGYVIAYRRVGGVADAEASIHLMFVDAQGNRSGTRLVRAATTGATGLDLMVANDGRIVVVWADTEKVADGEKTVVELRVRAARLTCAL